MVTRSKREYPVECGKTLRVVRICKYPEELLDFPVWYRHVLPDSDVKVAKDPGVDGLRAIRVVGMSYETQLSRHPVVKLFVNAFDK
jgi:hypothetical protein